MSNMQNLGIYLHLARASQRRNRPHVRDRLLLLSAAVAANQNLHKLSAYCRAEILKHNPQHMIGKWATVEEALLDEELLTLLKRIRSAYTAERAEQLLHTLGIDMTNERDAYYSDQEWAASILDLDPTAFDDEKERKQEDEHKQEDEKPDEEPGEERDDESGESAD